MSFFPLSGLHRTKPFHTIKCLRVKWFTYWQPQSVRKTNDSYAGRQRATMKEKNDNLSEFDVKGETPRDSAEKPPDEDKQGLLSKISGGVYNKAASVVGGVGWVAGTAFSTTYTAVSAVSGVALIPFRKSPKDKSD
ncbi:PREDICTED: transmembrane protein 263-like isoform X2 [Acropora digitifera]|uniref:transmembrane protein 263-like isoform X2 n=1 Tax=Acropora digitifera TaxID=70779 RepID=UPI00077A5533|nr:PREDICTED: transmembrane protein 263-like isoform X2 [Acropora digitifera]